MASPNFSSALLSEAPDHVERPKPLPEGTYLFTVGVWERGESKLKKTPFVRFPLICIAAEDDVDPDALDACGGCAGKKLSADFFLTDDAIYRLDAFHEHCGVDLSEKSSRLMRNDEVVNSQVRAYIGHDWPEGANKDDPDVQPFARLRRTLAAD